jgi:hypothetical protein
MDMEAGLPRMGRGLQGKTGVVYKKAGPPCGFVPIRGVNPVTCDLLRDFPLFRYLAAAPDVAGGTCNHL